MTLATEQLQRALKTAGYYSGAIDGIPGPLTTAAIIAFKRVHGLRPRAYVGPITRAALAAEVGRTALPRPRKGDTTTPPWINEINRAFGLHERIDNAALRAWLASDGATLGDPARLPWCGDAAATALKLALPREPWPEDLERNPYWARNFATFGTACGDVYGAVQVFERGSGGHVGFLVGVDPVLNRLYVRGGNQGDRVKDAWIDRRRRLASRWPATYSATRSRPAPRLDSAGRVLSRNEA